MASINKKNQVRERTGLKVPIILRNSKPIKRKTVKNNQKLKLFVKMPAFYNTFFKKKVNLLLIINKFQTKQNPISTRIKKKW